MTPAAISRSQFLTPPDSAVTPRRLIAWAERCFDAAHLFYGHGTDNPGDEAAFLVLRALGLPADAGAEVLDRPVPAPARQRLAGLVRQRVDERIPAAYLVGEAWFCGLPFHVNRHTHIPRSPLAELIEDGFSPWLTAAGVSGILDMCTGSGCIAIACALAFPGAVVDAVDNSRDALAVAAGNVDRYRLGERVRLIESDLYRELGQSRYDLIVANPPYVGSRELAALPREYHHEPAASLHAGDDGLDIVRRLLAEAKRYLKPGGILVVEVGNSQPVVARAFPRLPFTWLEFERGGHGVFLLSVDQL